MGKAVSHEVEGQHALVGGDIARRHGEPEHVAERHPGVDKVYAMQAGCEIRVMVLPDTIDDDGMVLLSRESAREIEQELEYPGQIKVTVIREARAVMFAR